MCHQILWSIFLAVHLSRFLPNCAHVLQFLYIAIQWLNESSLPITNIPAKIGNSCFTYLMELKYCVCAWHTWQCNTMQSNFHLIYSPPLILDFLIFRHFYGKMWYYEIESTSFIRHTFPIIEGVPEKKLISNIKHLKSNMCNRQNKALHFIYKKVRDN